MNHTNQNKEKKSVARNSVFAAIFLTLSKFIVGIITGSIGILSEALHSGLDLVAAAITYFSVRISDKPADNQHNFGHGKIENLSALIETILLFVTCVWIIYEATSRLLSGNFEIDVSIWAYIVVISSILIDLWRSSALSKAAKKFDSQALEADALHFSTDIWSSFVVLIGLISYQFGFQYADSIAALIVAIIVISVSYRLGKRAINVLIDAKPDDKYSIVIDILSKSYKINGFKNLRMRSAGAYVFVEVDILLNQNLTLELAHTISHEIEDTIISNIPNANVHIHIEPIINQRVTN
ncbi:MAG: cation transporter [Ignavibacteria bacterium GWF2_33_9]|nr:MAG: cation transporter [Ignavibacteria bacterium GWF2_33_9]